MDESPSCLTCSSQPSVLTLTAMMIEVEQKGGSSRDALCGRSDYYFGGKSFVWMSVVKCVVKITITFEIIELYERSRRKLRK